MKNYFHQAAALAAAALILSFARPTLAAVDQREDRWRFSSTPFLWPSGIDGDFTVGARTVDVDIGFDDILDATEYGFQTYLELRKEKFGFYANPSFIKLSADAQTDLGGASFEQDFWIVEFGGFYNLVNTQ